MKERDAPPRLPGWWTFEAWLVRDGEEREGGAQPRAGRNWTYQGLMGLVTLERQKSICRSCRRHSHSIWPEPWP